MATTLTDSLVGQLVDGRYMVVSRIARGGMATVYLATDRRLDREVALKVMHPHLADGASGADFVSRFRREARAAARLTHPGLVAVYDQGVDGDTSYLTMEYVDGTNLRRRMQDEGTLTVRECLSVVDDVLDALAAAHRQNLVHRDIKPENILLAADGRVKVADFGLARAVTEVTSTTTGTILGTVAYLGPELIARGLCDTRTDIYAVGVMAYEMLTGAQPFVGATPIQVAFMHVNNDIPAPSEVASWLPIEVDELVCAFAAREPDDRPTDAPTALSYLRRLRDALPDEMLDRRVDRPLPAPVDPADSEAATDDDGSARTALLVTGTVIADPTPSATDTDTEPDLDASDDDPYDDGPAPSRLVAVVTAPRPDPGVTALLDATDESSTAGTSAAAPATHSDSASEHLTQALSIGSSGSTIALSLGSARALMPGTAEAAEAAAGAEEARRVAAVGPRRRRRLVVWIISVALLLGALGGGAFWWFAAGPGAFTIVPAGLVEVPVSEATAALELAELSADPVDAFSDDVPAGTVISAAPGEGEKIRKDGTVALTVSQGIEHFTVPTGLTGISLTDSEAALKKNGFTQVSTTSDWNTTIPADTVMSVSVTEGASLPHNAPIVLAVSKGPEPVTVPQVSLLSLEDAGARLEPLDLTATTSEEYSESVPEGRVISQSVESGSQAHRGDQIALVISLGKPLVAVPDVLLKPVAEAQQILEDAGFEVKVKYYMGFFGNEVRSQSEAPGTQLRMGSKITLEL
ncbi:serine/threonine protein kinase [Sanguibacter gelidistatuariae]|uniref:non-specific serine/threonine protein kinase n=1 Tax=Sanguibacter gelidistatuariae TaxID=1814289 RepID=A0A1G6RFC1_9MICO|nr:Stk1 family PASTA domain-containing Ser/Thr kinase [Sanguibacter gelidistatuariae]SDD02586.1 serine/threonine protein kinase [Sanguibacter gelidistatuariae]